MTTMVFVVVAYLIGSLSFAVLVSRAFGLPDPRSFGSGNPGATNVLRTGKKLAAVLTLLGDAAKGWVAVFVARLFAVDAGLDDTALALVSVAVFVGHLFPVFFSFKGGKGVATALGVLLALNPWLGLAALATWLGVALIWKTSSLSALVAAVAVPFYAALLMPLGVYTVAAGVLSLLLIWRHQSNIRNLLSGAEGKIGASQGSGNASPSAVTGDSSPK
jgi:glycerol-3-phosphate acyltransferase PlsY